MPEHHDTDVLFKALADPSRRKLLDLLHAHDGRTLNELCEHLDTAREGVTQHLDLLEAANLVGAVRRGRGKAHPHRGDLLEAATRVATVRRGREKPQEA